MPELDHDPHRLERDLAPPSEHRVFPACAGVPLAGESLHFIRMVAYMLADRKLR
jgi:hypothetical protein